jgi:hypothetical protein
MSEIRQAPGQTILRAWTLAAVAIVLLSAGCASGRKRPKLDGGGGEPIADAAAGGGGGRGGTGGGGAGGAGAGGTGGMPDQSDAGAGDLAAAPDRAPSVDGAPAVDGAGVDVAPATDTGDAVAAADRADLAPPPPDAGADRPPDVASAGLPPGKLLFHRYTASDRGDAEMFVVNLPGASLGADLGRSYGLCNPINGSFSRDGRYVAVTAQAIPRNGDTCPATDRAAMEIFVLDLDQPPAKVRATENTVPDEDPHFLPASDRIIFKHDGHLALWSTTAGQPPFRTCASLATGSFCFNETGGQQSKPVVAPEDRTVCYAEGTGDATDLYCFELARGMLGMPLVALRFPAAVTPRLPEYHPAIDGDQLYYAAARAAGFPFDVIVRKPLGALAGPASPARFATNIAASYTDPAPLGGDLVVFSSVDGSVGGYDLFLARFDAETARSLNQLVSGSNTVKHELGAAFWRRR